MSTLNKGDHCAQKGEREPHGDRPNEVLGERTVEHVVWNWRRRPSHVSRVVRATANGVGGLVPDQSSLAAPEQGVPAHCGRWYL